ncbi:Bestrophin family protein [Aphelenchoides avenae]|nr:Bestrophin family protein [Aphelenchus avenae]
MTVWTVLYFAVSIVYRFILPTPVQRDFEKFAHHLDESLGYFPLVLMLGFFVTVVFDRWKRIFENIGFIDSPAFFINTYIKGDDNETRLLRKTIMRYLCLTQVLVLRDVSLRVRKRFPSMDAIEAAGYLTSEEKDKLLKLSDFHEHHWTPTNWACELVMRACADKKITSETLANSVLQVPIPLAYPQIVFVAVRCYFAICLFSRQFITHPSAPNVSELDLVVPFMTMLQVFFYLAWIKVAEELLNPLGTDEDDFESNYVIDRNLTVSMQLADRYAGTHPEQYRDAFDRNQPPIYAEKKAKDGTNHPYSGSASNVNLDKIHKTKMVPREGYTNGHVRQEKKSARAPRKRRFSHPLSFRRRPQHVVVPTVLPLREQIAMMDATFHYKTFPATAKKMYEESPFAESYSFQPRALRRTRNFSNDASTPSGDSRSVGPSLFSSPVMTPVDDFRDGIHPLDIVRMPKS